MRKVLLLLVGTAALWLPAVSVAGDSSRASSTKPAAATDETLQTGSHASIPASTCESQRGSVNFASSHSGQTFAQFYGTNRGKGRGAGAIALGKCVSTIAVHRAESNGKKSTEKDGEDSAERDGKDSAESQAKASEGDVGKDSAEGSGKDSAQSHGKGTAASEDSADNGHGRANPAMACKAMRAGDPDNFRTVYGARPNAFGKCVAKQANSTTG